MKLTVAVGLLLLALFLACCIEIAYAGAPLAPGTLPFDPGSVDLGMVCMSETPALHPVPCADYETPGRAPDRSWHVLAVTNGGTVNLLKGLTKHEADFTCDRMMGRPATKAEKAAAKKAADEAARSAAVKDRADDAYVRAHAPKCPAGMTREKDGPNFQTWAAQHADDQFLKLPSGNSAFACVLPSEAVRYLGWSFVPTFDYVGNPDPAAMKSCEVFQ